MLIGVALLYSSLFATAPTVNINRDNAIDYASLKQELDNIETVLKSTLNDYKRDLKNDLLKQLEKTIDNKLNRRLSAFDDMNSNGNNNNNNKDSNVKYLWLQPKVNFQIESVLVERMTDTLDHKW